MITSPIRGIVFDLDGVLLHSAPAHASAFEQVFQRRGIFDFEYAPYAGWRTAEVIADVLKRHGRSVDAVEIAALASEKSALARQALDATRPVAKEFDTLIPALAAHYRLGLASSGGQVSVDAFLRITGSRSMFKSILTGSDVANPKPHPEIYLRSLQGLGLNAKECLVVEDATAGVEAAHAAGIAVAGVAGTCSAKALHQAGASHVIANLGGLHTLLYSPEVPVDRTSWTAVIPAAGRGTRLGYSRPKILYPLAGRLILDWLLDLLVPHCARLVLVLSPDGVDDVRAELDRRLHNRSDVDYEVAIQATPTGMGDAVALALPAVRTPYTAVMWGDQVALRPESAEACMRLHEGPLHPDVTFPTVVRADPYIHFDRDAAGRLIGLKQARECDAMPAVGESDSGFFCFSTPRLKALLAELASDGGAEGTLTREFNLLPVLPMAAQQGLVLTPRLASPEEAIGINDDRDAAAAEDFLWSIHGR